MQVVAIEHNPVPKILGYHLVLLLRFAVPDIRGICFKPAVTGGGSKDHGHSVAKSLRQIPYLSSKDH